MLKRSFDVGMALVALLLLSPILALVALCVRVGMGSPILFSQPRPGLNGVVFNIYKFRTMRDAVDARGLPLVDAERLTALGRFLRATSLDELPELLNILRGDMSIVGPRPLLVRYLGRYSAQQARRHAVRPGLTGWAQVNGRNSLTWPQKFALDVWYVDHQSFWLDLRIIMMTFAKVVRSDGINASKDVPMAEFTGNEP